jgi:ribosomal protein L37AE/L43A
MSRPFSPKVIVRCPLCHDGGRPQHIGHGVMLCECCDNTFRVVYATLGKTGKKLGEYVKNTVHFASGPRTD